MLLYSSAAAPLGWHKAKVGLGVCRQRPLLNCHSFFLFDFALSGPLSFQAVSQLSTAAPGARLDH